ncbi:hypothetical protein ISS30_07940 [bacterium]|nr:hypothetical protein [FCB group bacterium]MBL7191614.1 hypothetical protein [bacterium]
MLKNQRILLVLLLLPAITLSAVNTTAVNEALPVDSDDFVRLSIYMERQGSLDYLLAETSDMNKADRRAFVINHLKDLAAESQAQVMSFLQQRRAEGLVKDMHIIWLVNSIALQAKPQVIKELKENFPEIGHIHIEQSVPTEQLMDDNGSTRNMIPLSSSVTDEISWGVQNINAPAVWAMGYQGQGVIVANLDTGTNYNHPDLQDHIWVNEDEIPNNGIDDDNNGYVDDWRR